MSHAWCNFCEENHDETTCEVKRNARDGVFGKELDETIVVLDWVQRDDFMVINTRNNTYTNKSKAYSSRTTFSPSLSS
jgi:hypothetical protein